MIRTKEQAIEALTMVKGTSADLKLINAVIRYLMDAPKPIKCSKYKFRTGEDYRDHLPCEGCEQPRYDM